MSILIGTELNASLKNLFDKRISTVILATVDQNQLPHIAPFNSIIAPDLKHLRLAISKEHQTYQNIIHDNHVVLAVLDEGDIAVSIHGTARIIRQYMENDYNSAVVEIDIERIKKDNSPYFLVTQGIRARHKNELMLLNSRKILYELMSIESIAD